MYTQFAGVDMLVYVSPHTYPSKIASDHVDCLLMPWCSLVLWNSIMIMDVNFLGTTVAGSVVYLSLITFLRMLLWSSRKLGSGFFFSYP